MCIRFAAILALAGMFLCSTAVQADGSRGRRGRDGQGNPGRQAPAPPEARAEGTVSAVTATSITITMQNKVTVTVMTNAATRIERNEKGVILAAIRVGDLAEIRYNSTTAIATRIETVGP
jgi:hypothetical protein